LRNLLTTFMEIPKFYKLIRSKRKTIALGVTADAILIVRAPHTTPLRYIERLLKKKMSWIQNAKQRAINRPRALPKEFIDGESFLYLGKSYKMRFDKNATKSIAFKNGFVLNTKVKSRIRNLIITWYKAEAKRKITERVEWCARRFGFSFKSVRITAAEKRWGSCGTSGNLNFSWRLIMAPTSVIDYVIIHELAHLEHKNHSKAFWNSVKVMYSNYEKARNWLKQNEGTLTI